MTAIFDQGPPPPCPEPFNMAAYVLSRATALADKPALEILGPDGPDSPVERWSYGALRQAVLATGGGLLATGLAPGDRVMLRLGNTVDFPIAYLGAIAVGLVPVPTSSQLTAPEVATLIAEVAPKAILADPALPLPDRVPPVIRLDSLCAMRDLPPAVFAQGDPDRLAYIVFTSGTSGRPRAVAHAHRAIWARQMMFEGWYGLRDTDRLLHAGAFNWTYTLGTGLMDPWTIGATALIPRPGTPPEALPDLLARHRATIFAAAPGVFRKMLSTPARLDLPALRHGLAAGEKLPASIRARFADATGCAIHEAYGMSECSTFISGAPDWPIDAHDSATLGRPQPGRRVAILGPDGPVDWDAEGVIAVSQRDPGLMLGYLNAQEETRARMQGEWFVTGDMGSMARDGSIRYLGRADDMMNAGGYRVSPLEVEAALLAHPAITEAAARDIEVKDGVRLIALFYVADRDLDEADLASFAAERLARYKQPRLFRRVPVLPRNPNGKLLRKALTLV